MRTKIYISGPITLGDKAHNFDQAAKAQDRLMALGFAPFNPMLSMKHPQQEEIPWAIWMDANLPWLQYADGVLRLPGKSKGADHEVAYAGARGIPIFTSIEQLSNWFADVYDHMGEPGR